MSSRSASSGPDSDTKETFLSRSSMLAALVSWRIDWSRWAAANDRIEKTRFPSATRVAVMSSAVQSTRQAWSRPDQMGNAVPSRAGGEDQEHDDEGWCAPAFYAGYLLVSAVMLAVAAEAEFKRIAYWRPLTRRMARRSGPC